MRRWLANRRWSRRVRDGLRDALDDDADAQQPDDSDDSSYVAVVSLVGDRATTLLGLEGHPAQWKEGLTDEEIERYKPIFDELREMNLTVPGILRSGLSDAEKRDAIATLVTDAPGSEAWRRTGELLLERKRRPLDAARMERYADAERRLESAHATPASRLKERILDLPLPEKQLAVVWARYQTWLRMHPTDSEHPKLWEWLQNVLGMPWVPQTAPTVATTAELRERVERLRTELDREVYGLRAVKEDLLVAMCDTQLQRNPRAQCITLQGSPGVGKTWLVMCMARAWGVPFAKVSAAGCKDSAFWDGHEPVYQLAAPGQIAEAVRRMGSLNGWIFIDELDKVDSPGAQAALLQILDAVQNEAFYDKYYGLPLDLRNVQFILSVNDVEPLHPALRSRLRLIRIPDPTAEDKVGTAQHVILPRALRNAKLAPDDVLFTDDGLRWILQHRAGREPGMRQFQNALETIVRRVAFLKHTLVGLPSGGCQAPETRTADQIRQEKKRFATSFSFYWPGFAVPLTIARAEAERLLSGFGTDGPEDRSRHMFG